VQSSKYTCKNESSDKADDLQMLKNNNEKIIKLTVNTGQVMFSGKIYYY